MPDVEQDLPGTWLVRVTQNGAPVSRAIVTYTSDRGLVERLEASMEGMIGIWEAGGDQKDHEKDRYRFMGYRYRHKLAVAPPWPQPSSPPPPPPVVAETFDYISRVRGTCHLTGKSTFHCTVTADSLDANENVIVTPAPAHFELDGVRMKLVPE